MADDGMLLNFDIGDAAISLKPTFKGGKWKDRLKAKRSANRSPRKPKISSDEPAKLPERKSEQKSSSLEASGERNFKRQRKDGEFRPATNNSGPRFIHNTDSEAPKTRDANKSQAKQYVTSLFTFNPESVTKEQIPSTQEEKVEPSNAPLTSELDTFTSLGLSSTLASHLLNKMGIKAPTAIQKAAITQLVKEDSDAFVQAETGSGKTLAYLLPIVQRIMQLSSTTLMQGSGNGNEAVQRSSGLFALVLAPTRELSKQIAVVLESILRCAHWIVGGTVIGGEKKKSEKARLRKGLNILVATPGRLADHLEHTEALDVSNVRWLVLDEGDRLMELGFENDIQKIVSILNLRMKSTQSRQNKLGLPTKRTTILCSATIKMNVQRLGDISLKDAVHIQANESDKSVAELSGDLTKDHDDTEFSAPAQLKQSYAIVPAKLRLVTLVAFLKRAFSRKGSVMKAIVFISCADSVDFHFNVLTQIGETAKSSTEEAQQLPSPPEDKNADRDREEIKEKEEAEKDDKEAQSSPKKAISKKSQSKRIQDQSATTYSLSPLLSTPTNQITAYRLHGSLPQHLRTSTLTHFARSKEPSLLIATDVASRGLDLPNVDLVLEYDAAFARDDHLHRIGRTARAGHDGRACIFLMPGCEEKYVDILAKDRKEGGSLARHTAEDLLKRAFETPTTGSHNPKAKKSGHSQRGPGWDDVATDLQLQIERWIIDNPERLESAKRGFQGHVRAYATHVAAERHCFDIKELHLGHLAKAFALRERPGGLGALGRKLDVGGAAGKKKARYSSGVAGIDGKNGGKDDDKTEAEEEAAKKMRKSVRMSKMLGVGADEFNLG